MIPQSLAPAPGTHPAVDPASCTLMGMGRFHMGTHLSAPCTLMHMRDVPRAHPRPLPGPHSDTQGPECAHSLPPKSRVHPPEGVLIHDVEGNSMETRWQVYLIFLTPKRAQGLPHGGCPIGAAFSVAAWGHPRSQAGPGLGGAV